jgi:hypothetical protein
MPRTKRLSQRIRIVLGTLLALNLAAAGLVLYPPGGSAENLERQLSAAQSQIGQRRALLESTRQHASAVEQGRADGDTFLRDYFLDRRAAFATVLAELGEAAQRSRMKEREISFGVEPVEGSDSLSMMTVTANYEGAYRDLLAFVAQVDRSPLLLIVESLSAAPQAGSNTLSVSMKIEAFVREDSPQPSGGPPPHQAAP